MDFLFQISDDEVRAAAADSQFTFESQGKWNGAMIESCLFFAIALQQPHYTRTQLAGITRAVNRLFAMPVLLLFRHGDTITLAIINRRLHKRNESKDVLEKVTLIKDIRFSGPHRAHIDILADLSFDTLRQKHDLTNFVALHAAWQKALDSSELNKRFYQEVANWYFWALGHIRFPKDAPKEADGRDHISVIRLITRLIFCWFVKEMGLIPNALFDEAKLSQVLNDFSPAEDADKSSTFYKAILQNLFFATLNTEMDQRAWARDEQNFMAHTLYRHRECFQKPNAGLDLFKNIPFLNGGLFECLDKVLGEKARPRYVRVDGFSRRPDSQPVVPDFLFFGPEREVDLSADYGEAKYKRAKVRGLIHTFDRYKFTVSENTPIEEEVALDPELSGNVFENLLAAYNPETGATARKQTGSFFTPREIVNYMVEERGRRLEDINEVFEQNSSDYGRKLYLIENCIYGVDIQPIAVQIAKMRFFISLIVDQKIDPQAPNLGVRPLPNLETKFVAANTLISINRTQQIVLRDPSIVAKEAELRLVRQRHFLARTPATKNKYREQDAALRAEIADLLRAYGTDPPTSRKLAAWDPYDQNASAEFFDTEWMFGLREGFHVTIGNPPYVRIQTLNQTDAEQAAWLKLHYASARKGNYDLYIVFVERSLQLLNPHGQLAFILPHKFFNAQYGQPLRSLLAGGKHLRHVVHFGDQQVFPGATNYVCLLFLAKAGADACRFVRANDLPVWLADRCAAEAVIPNARVTDSEWNFAVGRDMALFERLQQMPLKLGDVAARISQGIRTSANEIYVFDVVAEKGGLITVHSKQLNREVTLEREAVLRFLQGREIKAYSISSSGKVVLMPYKLASGRMTLLSAKEFQASWPKAWEYLTANRIYWEDREDGRMRHGDWYGFIYPKNLDVMFSSKILVPDIADRAAFALDENGEFSFTSGYGVTLKLGVQLLPKYLLGLLNSRLLDFYLKRVSTPLRGGFFRYFTQFIEQLPIRPINFADKTEKAQHDTLVGLADRILKAKRTNPSTDTTALEREIDERVYRLYGLTPEEIKIVEESAK